MSNIGSVSVSKLGAKWEAPESPKDMNNRGPSATSLVSKVKDKQQDKETQFPSGNFSPSSSRYKGEEAKTSKKSCSASSSQGNKGKEKKKLRKWSFSGRSSRVKTSKPASFSQSKNTSSEPPSGSVKKLTKQFENNSVNFCRK